MVSLVVCTSLIGLYSLPPVRRYLYPRSRNTSLLLLLFNATCILSMSSAVPLQASLLGLASPSFPPVYYSPLAKDGFCCFASHPCYPSSLSPSLSPPAPASLFDFKKSSAQYQEVNEDHSRERLFLINTHPKRQQTPPVATVSPTPSPTPRGMTIVLIYDLGFIGICWWLFRLHARDLVKVKQQLSSMWAMVIQQWLGAASSASATGSTQ